MKIAVIGSRETESHVMAFMCGLVRRIAVENPDIIWTSGGCKEGPDDIVTYLAKKYYINHVIYLPDEWKRKTMHRDGPDLNLVVAADYETDDKYRDIVNGLHPAPDALKDFHYKLHGRNLNIIAGEHLDDLVDAVLFAAKTNKDGSVKGGTGMGVAYARSRGVPTFNLNHMEDVNQLFTFLKNFNI